VNFFGVPAMHRSMQESAVVSTRRRKPRSKKFTGRIHIMQVGSADPPSEVKERGIGLQHPKKLTR